MPLELLRYIDMYHLNKNWQFFGNMNPLFKIEFFKFVIFFIKNNYYLNLFKIVIVKFFIFVVFFSVFSKLKKSLSLKKTNKILYTIISKIFN